MSGRGVEDEAVLPGDYIDAFGGGDEVGSSDICAWDVNLVVSFVEVVGFVSFVIVDAESVEGGEFSFPECSAGINVACGEGIDSFDEEPSRDDLLGRAVTVSRQYVAEICSFAEP